MPMNSTNPGLLGGIGVDRKIQELTKRYGGDDLSVGLLPSPPGFFEYPQGTIRSAPTDRFSGLISGPGAGLFRGLLDTSMDSGLPSMKSDNQIAREAADASLGLGPENMAGGGGGRGAGLFRGLAGLLGVRPGRKSLSTRGQKRMIEAAVKNRSAQGLLKKPMHPDFASSLSSAKALGIPLPTDKIKELMREDLNTLFIPANSIDFLPKLDQLSMSGSTTSAHIATARAFLEDIQTKRGFSEVSGVVMDPKSTAASRFAGDSSMQLAREIQALPRQVRTLIRRAMNESSKKALKDIGVPEQFVVFRASAPDKNVSLTPVTMSKEFAEDAFHFTDPNKGHKLTAHIINRDDVVVAVNHIRNKTQMLGDEFELLVPRKVLEKRPSALLRDLEQTPKGVSGATVRTDVELVNNDQARGHFIVSAELDHKKLPPKFVFGGAFIPNKAGRMDFVPADSHRELPGGMSKSYQVFLEGAEVADLPGLTARPVPSVMDKLLRQGVREISNGRPGVTVELHFPFTEGMEATIRKAGGIVLGPQNEKIGKVFFKDGKFIPASEAIPKLP